MTSHNYTPSVISSLAESSKSAGELANERMSSDESTSSDKSMISETSAVSVTSDEFKLKIGELMTSKALGIDKLEIRARGLISDLKNSGRYNHPFYGGSNFQKEVKLHRILEAMLHFAFDCGKNKGKRYAACAICACCVGDGSKSLDDHADHNETKLAYLQSLSTTWLSHVLFVFKANSSHRSQQNGMPSLIATGHTAKHLDVEADMERQKCFRNNVLLRDGHRCVITGRYDTEHPQVTEDLYDNQVDLQASYILCRAIATFTGPNKKDEYLSALTTFDILRNYADMPIESIIDTANVIDNPSNGIALDSNAHNSFEKFRWSLKETETPNQHTTVIFEKKGHALSKSGVGKTVTFTDHSQHFEPSSPSRKKPYSTAKWIDLPNPLFIRIHYAIAGVLHMSGVGESIDRALDRAGKSMTGVVLAGADFTYLGLAEDLERVMSQVAVH